jgi:hypothetical protein
MINNPIRTSALIGIGLMLTVRTCAPAIGATETSSQPAPTKVSSVNAYKTAGEEKEVIAVLETMCRSVVDHNFAEFRKHLDESCTTYIENTKEFIQGPDNIVKDLKARIAAAEQRLHAPILTYTIDRPFATVAGNTATVNFFVIQEVGGEHPQKLEAHCTDVFVKRDKEWKRLHFRAGDFKPLSVN